MADERARDGGVIIPEDVRGWIAREAPRWPALAAADVRAIATACNMERQAVARERAARERFGSRLRRARGKLKRLRLANETMLRELPAVIEEMESWGGLGEAAQPPHYAETLAVLRAQLDQARAFRLYLEPARSPGGNRAVWHDLAWRLAVHLQDHGDRQKVRASYQPAEPLVGVIAAAVTAVYAREITPEAVAQALKRRARTSASPRTPSSRGGHG